MKTGRRCTRLWCAFLTCLMVSAMFCRPSWAAVKAISGVTLRVGINITAGDTLPDIDIIPGDLSVQDEYPAYVGTNSEKYSVRFAEWVTDDERYMSIGDQPRMRVYLEPYDPDSYTFRGTYSSSNVTVKGGKLVSARRESDGELAVVVMLSGIKGQYSAPVSAEWRDSGYGRAVWYPDYEDYDDYADAVTSDYYDLCLYRGSTLIHKVEDYRGTTYNFYPYMTRKGTYFYRVRSVPHTETEKQYGTKSEWMESDEIYIDEEHVSDGSGRTNVDDVTTGAGTTQTGWIESNGTWYFRYPNGAYQTNGWLKLNGIWYLFDSSGRMQTGWQQDKGQWYYLQANGAMYTGWIKAGDYWYYLNTLADGGTEGAMHTGWLTTGGKTYYLNSSGIMMEGWQEIDKKFYYFYPGYGYVAKNTTIDTYFRVDANGAWVQ